MWKQAVTRNKVKTKTTYCFHKARDRTVYSVSEVLWGKHWYLRKREYKVISRFLLLEPAMKAGIRVQQTWVHSWMPIQNNFPSIGFELLPNIPGWCLLSECLAVIQNLWRENYFEWAFVNGPKSGIDANSIISLIQRINVNGGPFLSLLLGMCSVEITLFRVTKYRHFCRFQMIFSGCWASSKNVFSLQIKNNTCWNF